MEIPCGHKLLHIEKASTSKLFRSNPFLESNKEKKGYVSDLVRQSTLRGHSMSQLESSPVMSLLDSPVEISQNSIQFSGETEFLEFCPELEEHFEGSMFLFTLRPIHKMRLYHRRADLIKKIWDKEH